MSLARPLARPLVRALPHSLIKGVGVLNNFSPIKAKIEAEAADVVFLFNGDSTGNDNNEWIYLFAAYLGEQYPTHTVRYALWDDVNTLDYAALSTISTGSGARNIDIYNASVGGLDPIGMLDARFDNAIAAIPADIVVWSHGHNVDLTTGVGIFWTGFENVKLAKPDAMTVIVKQNPWRDSSSQDAAFGYAETTAGLYGDTVVDAYAKFIAAGKPPGWYADNVHPSATGQEEGFLAAVVQVWEAARAGAKAPSVAFLSTTAQNLLNLDGSSVDQGYGYFSGYVSGTPTGWTFSGTATLSKDTVEFDSAMGDTFSLKIEQTAASLLQRSVSTPTLAAAKTAGTVTFAVRKLVAADQSNNTGRFFVNQSGTGGVNLTSKAQSRAKARWMWEVLSPRPVASTITFLTPGVWGSTAAETATARYGRAVLVAGNVPRNDQSAPTP